MKQIITEEVYCKQFEGEYATIRFSDLPKDIRDNDIIQINREGSHYSENNSYDAYTALIIVRPREETDEEYAKRIDKNFKHTEQLRQSRYQTYLKLKKEFEPYEG